MEQVTAPASESVRTDSPLPTIESPVPSSVPPLPSDGCPEGTITVEPRVLRILDPQPRSIGRRIAEALCWGSRLWHYSVYGSGRQSNIPS